MNDGEKQMTSRYSNGGAQCDSGDKIDEIHGRVMNIDDALQGLVKDLIGEIKSFNKSMMRAICYIAIGLCGLWFLDHFGIDRTQEFITKVRADQSK